MKLMTAIFVPKKARCLPIHPLGLTPKPNVKNGWSELHSLSHR